MKRLYTSLLIAAVSWFILFSPWTKQYIDFWLGMSIAGGILMTFAFYAGQPWPKLDWQVRPLIVHAVTVTILLWGVFWLGDKVAQVLFSFARAQVDTIYALKEGSSKIRIGLLLLCLIGPAEEIFWRGYVQRLFSTRWGKNQGYILTLMLYTLIHIWSGNFMLIAAAGVCGGAWGLLYRLWPKQLPAWVLSHALWDTLAFVAFPF